MERDKLLDISKGGRLQVDSSDLESESARIDQIEEELKRSVFKEKKVSKTAAVGRILVKNYAELQSNWDKETLYKATKNLKDGWDEIILSAQAKGMGSEELFKMVHSDDTTSGLMSAFEKETAKLKDSDRKEALNNFKDYQKISQRKIRRQAAIEQLKLRRAKAERGLEDLRISVIEDRESDKAIQSRFTDLVKSLGFSESDRKIYNAAARDALSRGRLDRAVSRLNETKANKELKKNKSKLTAREYSAYTRAIGQIPEKVNKLGDAIITDPNMEARGQYILSHKDSLYGRIFQLEEGRLLSSFSKNGRIALPSKQEYIDTALLATKGKSKEEQNKAVKRAAKAYESWKIFLRDNKREALVSRIDKKEWDKLPEDTKFNATGQAFDTMKERRQVGQQALLAYKNNNFATYRNELLRASEGNQEVVDRKLKEALLQLRKDNPKANKDAGGSFIDMLEVEIHAPGTLKFNKNSITRELEKGMKTPKYADLDEAYNLDGDLAELGNQMENLVGSMPGGPAMMRVLALQARAYARTAPLDENSDVPPEEQRKILFGEKLKELYQETLDNEKLLGDRGKWTRMDGAGVNGRVFLFDNAAIGADVQRGNNVVEMSEAIKNGDILETGILAADYLDKDIEQPFLQRNPKTNEIELWATVINEEDGTRQQVHLTDSNGVGLTTTDNEIAVYGVGAFSRNSIFKSVLHRPYDKTKKLGIKDIVDTVTKGSNTPLAKQDADVVATLKTVLGDETPSGILPPKLRIRGKNYSNASIKDQLKVVKSVEKDILGVIKGRGGGWHHTVDSWLGGRSADDVDPRIPKIITILALNKNSLVMDKDGKLDKGKVEEAYKVLDRLYQPNLANQFISPFPEKLEPIHEQLMTVLYSLKAVKMQQSDLMLPALNQWNMTKKQIEEYNKVRVRAFNAGAYKIRSKGLQHNGYDLTGGKWSYRIPRQELTEKNPPKTTEPKRDVGIQEYRGPRVGSK